MTSNDAAPRAQGNNGDQIFAEIPIRHGEKLRVALSKFKGNTFVAVRVWYADDEGLKPSNKGVNVRIEHLPAIAEGLAKALEAAKTEGLVP